VTPLDLDALASDISVGIHGGDRFAALAALCTLIAEIERLRALEADAERVRVKAELWNYYAAFVAANGAGSITELVVQRDEARAAVGAERAAVVAWLRARGVEIENWPPGGRNEISLTYDIIADNIERGEHRREEEK
jgi:hypothetical protein